MYTYNHVLFIHTPAWHDHELQPVCDRDLTLQDFPSLNVLPTCLGNARSDAKEDDGWQFAWQDTCSRTETFFKSLQFFRTSICGSSSSIIDGCAMRRMPCSNFLISKLSFRSHPFFPLKECLCNNYPQGLLLAANQEPPCQQFLRLL